MIWPRGAIRRSTTIEHLVKLVKASGENKTIFFVWDERVYPCKLVPTSYFDRKHMTFSPRLFVDEHLSIALWCVALEDLDGFIDNQSQMFFSNYWHAYAFVQKSKRIQLHENR